MKRRRGGPGRLLAPERVHEKLGRDDVIRLEQEHCEDRALLLAAERERAPVVGEYLERPEDPELRHTRVVAARAAEYEVSQQRRTITR